MLGQYYRHSLLSTAVEQWKRSGEPLGRGYRDSTLKRTLDRFEAVCRQSWFVRWLTTEPDPQVIVIDLGESRTVGPILTLLVGLVPRVVELWEGSETRRIVNRARLMFDDAPVQLTSALLLVVLAVQFALSWGSASDRSLGLLALLAAPALLGLRVTSTWDELAESRAGQFAAALFVPPDPPTDEN